MRDHCGGNAPPVGARAAVFHRVREDRERDADVRREPALARSGRGDRKRGVVPRVPQLRARLGRRHCLEGGHVLPAADLASGRDLLVASVELDEEARRFLVRRSLVRVHRPERRLIEQLATRDRQAGADERHGGAARGTDVRERGADRDRALGQAVQAQRELGDHAERSLRADEERAQVVAGRRLDRARARSDHRSVGEHDLEREHVRAHAAVADGRRAARVGRRHPAERRVRSRIDGEPQTVLGDRGVQLAAEHARLRARLQVAGKHLEDAVQAREVERERAVGGDHVAFERRSGAEGNDGDAVLVRPREHAGDVLGRLGKDDRHGRAPRVVAQVARVQVEHRLARRDLCVPEQRAELVGDLHQCSTSCGHADAGSFARSR